MGKLKQKRLLKKISDGLIGWHCEWCGQEVITEEGAKPEEILKAAQTHNLNCKKNPLVKDD